MLGCLYYYWGKDCESQLYYMVWRLGKGLSRPDKDDGICGYLIEVVCVFIAITTCCARNHIPLQT